MSLFATNQLFLVTGASSGIGREIALRLYAEGATVLAQGRNKERLSALQAEVSEPERMQTIVYDFFADTSKIQLWLAKLCTSYGRLTGLVCAAGITWNCPLSFYPLDKAHTLFDVCCHAPLMLGGAFCQKKHHAATNSAIVYIAAAAAVNPNPGQGIYAAAKAALVAGAKCLSKEAAPHIRVNCISPRLVDTPMMHETVQQLGDSFLEREKPHYPLGFGTTDDVAHLAVFLLSDHARWITGQNILLGGM